MIPFFVSIFHISLYLIHSNSPDLLGETPGICSAINSPALLLSRVANSPDIKQIFSILSL